MQYGWQNIRNSTQYFLHLVLFSLCAFLGVVFVLHVLFMCICCTSNFMSIRCILFVFVVLLMCICCILCLFVLSYVYLLYYVCIAVLTLDAGLLARSQ